MAKSLASQIHVALIMVNGKSVDLSMMTGKELMEDICKYDHIIRTKKQVAETAAEVASLWNDKKGEATFKEILDELGHTHNVDKNDGLFSITVEQLKEAWAKLKANK